MVTTLNLLFTLLILRLLIGTSGGMFLTFLKTLQELLKEFGTYELGIASMAIHCSNCFSQQSFRDIFYLSLIRLSSFVLEYVPETLVNYGIVMTISLFLRLYIFE